jgi:hypothetical protein
MPKNQFQRPQAVARNHNVPRHGAPVPTPRTEAKKLIQPKPATTMSLPALEALLKSTGS